MFRAIFTLTIFAFLACSRHATPVGPEEIVTEEGSVMRLSFTENPVRNGTRCMYDRPGLLYWSRIGITATVLDKGQWVYHTYSWNHIGIKPDAGETSYGINNGRITFPGDMKAIWTPKDSSG